MARSQNSHWPLGRTPGGSSRSLQAKLSTRSTQSSVQRSTSHFKLVSCIAPAPSRSNSRCRCSISACPRAQVVTARPQLPLPALRHSPSRVSQGVAPSRRRRPHGRHYPIFDSDFAFNPRAIVFHCVRAFDDITGLEGLTSTDWREASPVSIVAFSAHTWRCHVSPTSVDTCRHGLGVTGEPVMLAEVQSIIHLAWFRRQTGFS